MPVYKLKVFGEGEWTERITDPIFLEDIVIRFAKQDLLGQRTVFVQDGEGNVSKWIVTCQMEPSYTARRVV